MTLLNLIRFKLAARRLAVLLEMRRTARLNQLRTAYVTRERGFTLIELMIALGIGAILLAIAIPAYASFATKADVSEGVQLANGAEAAVNESISNSGLVPGNSLEAGYAQQVGRYVTSMTVGGAGQVTATYGGANAPADIVGTTLTFTPYTTSDGSTIAWVCGTAPVPAGWTAFAADAAGAGNPAPPTTVPAKFLSKACHS